MSINLRSFLFSVCVTLFSTAALAGHEYNLAVCMIFKDSAPYLKEWIEYHRLVGVDHFFLFDNSSTDNPRRVLKKYIASGVVTLIDWPNRSEEFWGDHLFAWVGTTQLPAYGYGRALALNKAKWLAFIDSDEFLVPVSTMSLTELLAAHDDAPAVYLNWIIYGTSDVYDIPPGKLMLELLTKRARMDHHLHRHTKTIIKPEEFAGWAWAPHECSCRNGTPYRASYAEARVNHYHFRTLRFFFKHKVKQKSTMDNTPEWSEETIQQQLCEGNDEEDRTMDRFIPELRKKMDFN